MNDYKKIGWVDHIEDIVTGEVVQEGTPISALNLNHMDEGISENRKLIQKQKSEQSDILSKKQDSITAQGLLKRDEAGNIVSAVAGVDYGLPAPEAEPDTPLEEIAGTAGQHYYDAETGKEYICTGQDSEGNYIWKEAGGAREYYAVFEPSDWLDSALRIPAEAHGMEPKRTACLHTLRQRVGRTAYEYDDAHAALAAEALLDGVKAALAANTATSGSYPTAEDGHVQLTWEQAQYYLLESVLAPADEAGAKAVELGFNWRDRDNGAEESVSLDELLAAAYIPALGGSTTAYHALFTPAVLQGLRFRWSIGGQGYHAKYDLDGALMQTWGTVSGSDVRWDLDTKELVLRSDEPYAGDLLVMG